MLKWFKENIIEPIKEGVEEAKAELAVEKAEKEKLEEEFEATFETISQEEKLALALAAPFRCVATGQYVSLFDIDEEEAQRKPPCRGAHHNGRGRISGDNPIMRQRA